MRKLLFTSLLFLAVPSFAATYWACASANINAGSEWDATSSACGARVTPTFAAGDILNSNNFTVAVNVDPGANGTVTLQTSTGGGFTCATATGPATIHANITATSVGAAVLVTSGSSGTGCNVTGNITGGSAASAVGVSDTHTGAGVNVTYTGNVAGGSSSSSANGIVFNTASGTITIAGNVKAGTAAIGLTLASSTGGSATVNGNCVGSDTANGTVGCGGSTSSSSGAITVTGSIVNGKFAFGASGKVYWTPASTASAFYMAGGATASSYASTDIVDANGAVKSPPTFTNAFVFPAAFATNGIGTGCNSSGISCSNVATGIVFGPYTGSLASTAQNSGNAQ